jgi:lipopolysaccharide transport system ATP-binding protein
MSDVVIQVENLSKFYRLGVVNTGTLSHDLNRWWARLRGKPDPALRVDQARKSVNGTPEHYGDDDYIWALRDINFEVKQGEVLGIIGRNGAGKSTLLKILSRVTAPTTGECRVKGRIASLLEVGTGFHPELTGRENIYLNGAILGMTKDEIGRKFDEIVAFSEVEKYIDTPVKRYSSGMYVRLAFAVAAHLDPEILIVDEVLAVGDAAFQKKCLGKMQDVSKGGRTVLFVSHNMGAVQNLCSRSLLLINGQIHSDALTTEVIEKYLNSFQSRASLSLVERTDRRGEGQIRFTMVELMNKEYKPLDHAISGDKLIIRLYYKANTNRDFRNSRASISVHSYINTYFLASTELVKREELVLNGEGYLDCVIEELPLSKGEYYLNAFVESNKVIQDWVEAAAKLSVIDGDYYGTGKNYPPGWEGKTVLVKHRWE